MRLCACAGTSQFSIPTTKEADNKGPITSGEFARVIDVDVDVCGAENFVGRGGRPEDRAAAWAVVGGLHGGAGGSCDCDEIGVMRVCRTFYTVADGKKSVEPLNKRRVTVEKM